MRSAYIQAWSQILKDLEYLSVDGAHDALEDILADRPHSVTVWKAMDACARIAECYRRVCIANPAARHSESPRATARKAVGA